MKLATLALLTACLVSACHKQEPRRKDPVSGREIIELEDGKAYVLKSKSHHLPQLEISISKDHFGFAQLASDGSGVPPIMIVSKGGVLEVYRAWIENGNEVIVMDKDGDGFADSRMTVPQDQSSSNHVKIEDVSYQFSRRESKKEVPSEQDGIEPPSTPNPSP